MLQASRAERVVIGGILCFALCAVGAGAYPVRDDVMSVHIFADKSVYHFGETIKIRVVVTNLTGREYGLLREPASTLTDLIVEDDHGNILKSKGGRGNRADSRLMPVAPGQTVALLYYESGLSPASEWEPLNAFGYSSLSRGTYTIYAVPKLLGAQLSPAGYPDGAFETSGKVVSNTIQIKVI